MCIARWAIWSRLSLQVIRQPTVRVVRVLSRSGRAGCIAGLSGGLEIGGLEIEGIRI